MLCCGRELTGLRHDIYPTSSELFHVIQEWERVSAACQPSGLLLAKQVFTYAMIQATVDGDWRAGLTLKPGIFDPEITHTKCLMVSQMEEAGIHHSPIRIRYLKVK